MMHTVLPREEAVEAIFSKIVASPASCEQLREVVYEHLEDEQIFEKNHGRAFYRSFISGIQEWRYQCIVAGIVWKKYV